MATTRSFDSEMGDSSISPLLLIGAGSSFAFSGLFYHLYQEKKKELKKLKKIPIFRPDQHFVEVLNSTPHKRLQYVAVEGVVQADGELLRSQFVRCSGVIQKIATVEQWKTLNYVNKTWNTRTVNRTEINNSVPFSLVSPGGRHMPDDDVYLRVQNPVEASGSFLERVYFKTRRAEEGAADALLQVLKGEKPVAMVESEEMLRAGSSLMGFREVVLLQGSQVAARLQAPQDGLKYILVAGDHRSFMDRHKASASVWKTLTAASGIAGASSLLAGLVYNFTLKQCQRSN